MKKQQNGKKRLVLKNSVHFNVLNPTEKKKKGEEKKRRQR